MAIVLTVLWILLSLIVAAIIAIVTVVVSDVLNFDDFIKSICAIFLPLIIFILVLHAPYFTDSGEKVIQLKEVKTIYTEELKKDVILYNKVPDYLVDRVNEYNARIANVNEDLWTKIVGFSKEHYTINLDENYYRLE